MGRRFGDVVHAGGVAVVWLALVAFVVPPANPCSRTVGHYLSGDTSCTAAWKAGLPPVDRFLSDLYDLPLPWSPFLFLGLVSLILVTLVVLLTRRAFRANR